MKLQINLDYKSIKWFHELNNIPEIKKWINNCPDNWDFDKTLNWFYEYNKRSKQIYYFEYLRDLSDPERVVEATLREEGYKIKEVYDFFPGVGQIFYWTKNANN